MIRSAQAGVLSATHNADFIEVNIADDTLIAPKDGPIEYRTHNLGEVLPAGGLVFTTNHSSQRLSRSCCTGRRILRVVRDPLPTLGDPILAVEQLKARS